MIFRHVHALRSPSILEICKCMSNDLVRCENRGMTTAGRQDDIVEVLERVSISGATEALARAIEDCRFTHILVCL